MVAIFQYHQVNHVPRGLDPRGLAVTPEAFDAQMAHLRRSGYHCLTLAELYHGLARGAVFPPKQFVLTFDDGFRDLALTVSPILKRYGFRATVFAVAGGMGGPSAWEGQDGPRVAPLLSWDEARGLAQDGFDFASHTLTHPSLPRLDDAAVRGETAGSRRLLEEQLGRPVRFFAYPYSRFDSRIQRIVAESYDAACAGDRGAWGFYNLWRAEVEAGDTPLTFALKARGWFYRYVWLREEFPIGRRLRLAARSVRPAERTGA